MASLTGFDYGIKKGLTGKGVNNADIGYNPSSKYVTVKGANAIKAPKTYMGTSFTSQNDFNNDWSNFQKSQQQPGLGAVAGAGAAAVDATMQQPTPQPKSDPMQDLIKALLSQAQNPTPVDVNAIYGSPQWAAQQAQAQRGAQQGIRAAQESLGSAGFGRSTVLGERAQGIQNQANEYLQTQVLPQFMAQEEAARQQQFQNQFSTLDALMKQKDAADRLAIDEGTLTGSYLPPEGRRLIDENIQLGEAWKTADTPEQRDQLHQEAEQNRALLAAMGIDPSLFGADVSTEGRIANIGKAGIKTQAAREFEENAAYTEARDKILDERAKEKFDFDVEQKGLEFAADEAYRRGQLSREDARIAISRAAESRLSKQEEEKEEEEKPIKIDAKTSADNYDLLYDDLQTDGITKEQARQLIEANRDFLTDSDYKNLRNWANDNL